MWTNLVCGLCWIGLAAIPALPAEPAEWRQLMLEAQTARQQGRMHDAQHAYEQAIRVSAAEGQPSIQYAIALTKHASVLHDLQQTRAAEKGYTDALNVLRRLSPDVARTSEIPVLINLAALYLEQNRTGKAMSLGLQDKIEHIQAPADKTNAYGVLGHLAFGQRRMADAEALWLRALTLSEAGNHRENAAVVLSNLGVAAMEKGDYKAGVAYLRRSMSNFTIALSLEHPLSVKPQANLGEALYRLGQYQEAADWLERAQRLARKWFGNENVTTATLCLNYAIALRKVGRKNEAKALIEEVKRLPASITASLPGRNTVSALRPHGDLVGR